MTRVYWDEVLDCAVVEQTFELDPKIARIVLPHIIGRTHPDHLLLCVKADYVHDVRKDAVDVELKYYGVSPSHWYEPAKWAWRGDAL